MVAQTQKSGLLARIAQRAKQVQSEVSKTPINYGNPTLPAGINNGIAQLDWIRFGEFKDGDNKGQIYMMAMATVKRPTHHEEVSIVGLKTQIGPEPFCDTPKSQGKRKTFAEHYNWICDEIAKIGDIKKEEINIDNMEAISQKLTKLRPFIRFRTWSGKKQTTGPYAGKEPKINHDWNGRIEWTETDNSDPMTDNGKASTNGEGQYQLENKQVDTTMGEEPFNEFDNPGDDNASGSSESPSGEENQESQEEQQTELTEEQKLELLISLADDIENSDEPNEQARVTLQSMFKKAGVTEQEIIEADSHREVVVVMHKRIEANNAKESEAKNKDNAKSEPKETTPKKEAKKDPPKVGDTCKWQKNKTSKVTDCEIMSVNLTAGIVTLKDMATETIHKGIKIENIKLD